MKAERDGIAAGRIEDLEPIIAPGDRLLQITGLVGGDIQLAIAAGTVMDGDGVIPIAAAIEPVVVPILLDQAILQLRPGHGLARRINRIARGRTGPNIQTAMQMGETCRQLHQLLGMPGYPPTLGAVVPAPGQ